MRVIIDEDVTMGDIIFASGGDLFLLEDGNFTLDANLTMMIGPESIQKPHQVYIEDGCSLNMEDNSNIYIHSNEV